MSYWSTCTEKRGWLQCVAVSIARMLTAAETTQKYTWLYRQSVDTWRRSIRNCCESLYAHITEALYKITIYKLNYWNSSHNTSLQLPVPCNCALTLYTISWLCQNLMDASWNDRNSLHRASPEQSLETALYRRWRKQFFGSALLQLLLCNTRNEPANDLLIDDIANVRHFSSCAVLFCVRPRLFV